MFGSRLAHAISLLLPLINVVVDFMSKMRQMPLTHYTQFPNMGVVIDAIITSASFLCQKCEVHPSGI